MDQASAGNRLRVSLVVLFSKINCGELESQKSFQVGLHPPHNFPWTHIVTDNLAQSCFLLEQFYIPGDTVVRNLANFGGNGCG